MTQPPALVFSDLDGTLLDHDNYGWDPARPMLDRLARAGIPVILASSKTAAEMIPLRAALGLGAVPMICENGAGLVQEAQQLADELTDYDQLRATLGRLDPELRTNFEGFGDMGVQRIARVTGLSEENAGLAAQRRFSEPGLWHGTQAGQVEFVAALRAMGISARMGGRFLTLSFGGTKADRMASIAARYGAPVSVALGDAPNDIEMLQAADYGIVVANPHRDPLPQLPGEAEGRIRRTVLPGPAGWTEGLAGLLSDLGIAATN